MSTFKVGDRVRIAEGAHADRTGTVITMFGGALALRVDAEDGQARGGRGGFVCDVNKYNLVLL